MEFPYIKRKTSKTPCLACKTYSSVSVTYFCYFAIRSHTFSRKFLTVHIYFKIISASEPQNRKTDLPIPSKPFLIAIVGFVIVNNMSTSEPFARYIVPILDSSYSLDDYTRQVALAARPPLVYSNNYIKAAQIGGGFSVLQLLFLTIVHTSIYLVGDTIRELDVKTAEAGVIHAPYVNALLMLFLNSKAKEEMFRSNFLVSDVQDFLALYQNAMNKDDYLRNYSTKERKEPSIIYQIEASIVSALN